jgi:hypothetical protein
MPLLKNNKQITGADQNKIDSILKEQFPEWPKKRVTLKILLRLIKREGDNKKLDYPSCPLIWDQEVNVPQKDGTISKERWIYYESMRKDNNREIYEPGSEPFDKSISFGPADKEKLFFTYYCIPQVENGFNASNAKIHYYEFDRPQLKAAKLIEKEKNIKKIKDIILDDNITENLLREYANALFVSNVKDLSKEEIQAKIISIAETNQNNIDSIIKLIGADTYRETKAIVQQAIDEGFLLEDRRSHAWFWLVDGKKDTQICKIPIGVNSKEAVFNHLTSNKDDFERIKNAIEILS